MAKHKIHKYYHAEMKNYGGKLWTCALPDCSHHMPLHYENTLIGKLTICWNCEEPTILDYENMQEDMPRCQKCRGLVKPDLIDFLEQHGVK